MAISGGIWVAIRESVSGNANIADDRVICLNQIETGTFVAPS